MFKPRWGSKVRSSSSYAEVSSDPEVRAGLEAVFDVPTFIRRGGHAENDEEAEEPAFLRRSAD